MAFSKQIITFSLQTDSNHVVKQSAGIHIEDLAPLLVSPDVADRFYKYRGSLTTPGCYESVTWFVMNNHPQITETEVSNAVYSTIYIAQFNELVYHLSGSFFLLLVNLRGNVLAN